MFVVAPRTPTDVLVTANSSTALRITWKLDTSRCYSNVTYYNVTADGRDVTFPNDMYTILFTDVCEMDSCQGNRVHTHVN